MTRRIARLIVSLVAVASLLAVGIGMFTASPASAAMTCRARSTSLC